MKFLSVCVCLFTFCLVGCGGAASGVSGKVTVSNGEKVNSGNLSFSPSSGNGETVTATIKEDGSYSVNGAVVGKAKVVFAPATSTDSVALQPGEVAKPAPFSGYKVKTEEVELKSGSNEVNVELIPPPAQPQ